MDYLPIFLNVQGRKCIVIGGGDVALRKAILLHRAGGSLQIIATDASAKLKVWCEQSQSNLKIKDFDSEDLNGASLVVAATDDSDINKAVRDLALSIDIPVNVVDQPELSSFIMPAIVDKSPVVIAVSSGGNSPVLTRHIKELTETLLPEKIGRLAELLGSYRQRVKSEIEDFPQRLEFWEGVLESEIPELVYAGDEKKAGRLIDARINNTEKRAPEGEVYLVGAGPGDPDLLTLRALRLMYKADIVLYDRLVSKEIMKKLRPDAEQIHVGKQRSNHSVDQETINETLVRLAKSGKKVLRLKGGDPFIFGRGGEELETLAKSGVSFQVVPGITAASGCAAYAGIPLTHRDHSQSVRFLTGHLQEGELELDWETLAKEHQTLVFYMGLHGLSRICAELIKHGMKKSLPIAMVQQGTTSNQKVVTGTIETMPEVVKQEKLEAPTIIIIGEVVSLRENLSWFG